MNSTENLNIRQFKSLITPNDLKRELSEAMDVAFVVVKARTRIEQILTNKDRRRIVITGPCSLHDRDASLEYAERLCRLQEAVKDTLLIVMRCYFEKPRSTLGWKGMLYDPYLDDSCDIEAGFRRARSLLLAVGAMELPTATEFLDPIVPQYVSDLISWAAIGARTTESQIHRQMVSGLSMPVGFKNATDGNPTTAIAAIKTASSPHSFMGIDGNGRVVIAETSGNPYGHLVMRGGTHEPNYSEEYIAFSQVLLRKADVPTGVIIDCSHANSHKDPTRQRAVLADVAQQIHNGNRLITGVMLESFLHEGNQEIVTREALKYGVSVTDKCIGWEETEELIHSFAETVSHCF
jgi:3-deoxy-7-phosphoheptulonate synthase